MEIEVSFRTSFEQWAVPGSYFVKTDSTREELQEIVFSIVEKKAKTPLVFTLNSYPLTGSLQEYFLYRLIDFLGISTENKVELWFYLESPPFEFDSETECKDWVSCVRLADSHVFASDYSGLIQKFTEISMVSQLSCFKEPLKSFSISRETKQISSISKKGDIKILDFDLNTIAYGNNNNEHSEKVEWNPTGSSFAIGCYSGKVNLCKVGEDQAYVSHGFKRRELDSASISNYPLEINHSDAVTEILWPSLETLISSSLDHNILVTDLETFKISGSLLCPRVN